MSCGNQVPFEEVRVSILPPFPDDGEAVRERYSVDLYMEVEVVVASDSYVDLGDRTIYEQVHITMTPYQARQLSSRLEELACNAKIFDIEA